MTEPRALVGNASDPEQVEAAERAEKRLQVSREGAREAVMKTYAGRQFVWELLGRCGTFESVMREGPTMRDYYAGRQDLGHEYISELKDQPDLYLQMQQEAMERQKRLTATRKRSQQEGIADARAEA